MKHLLFGLGLLSIFGCGEQKFKASVATASRSQNAEPETATAKPTPPNNRTVSEEGAGSNPPIQGTVGGETTKPSFPTAKEKTFELTGSGGIVDIIWAIDNSGSMVNESKYVADNFDKFAKAVAERVDVKIALLSSTPGKSAECASCGVTMSAAMKSAGHIQIDLPIYSLGALPAAAAASCRAVETNLSGQLVCGTKFNSKNVTSEDSIVEALKGTISSFLRPGSHRVYVFVTDDEPAGYVDDKNFVQLVSKDSASVTVFGFTAIADKREAKCDISKRGATFEALAAFTKGEIFDICDPDWTSNFSKLTANIIKIGASAFPLEDKGALKITSVTLNGKALASPTHYTLKGGVIQLNVDQLPSKTGTVVVKYTVQ